jgi:antirestriction protein ArdC
MKSRFGDEDFSREILVAELCLAFRCSVSVLKTDIRNSTSYIRSWSGVLRENQKWNVWASATAEKTANYFLWERIEGTNPLELAGEDVKLPVPSEIPV